MEQRSYIPNIPDTERKRVVVIGGGFAGLKLVRQLLGQDFQIILLDKNNFHQFQPLFYRQPPRPPLLTIGPHHLRPIPLKPGRSHSYRDTGMRSTLSSSPSNLRTESSSLSAAHSSRRHSDRPCSGEGIPRASSSIRTPPWTGM